jgi:GT2 family glycosyltransferase
VSVSVSLVTHRSRAHLDACLASVRAQGPLVREILAVDAASGDGTVAWLRARHPDVRLEALDHNAGYAAGHNRNFARASGGWFLALNPDVVLRPGFVSRLVEALERAPRAGAASGRLLGAGGRLDSAGIARTPGRTRFVDRGRGASSARFAREEDVFGACGAAALYRRRALEQVARPGEAPFAERFFMYYEDVDLAWRLARAGWSTRYVPSAECTHVRGGSGADPAFVEYHLVRNRLWLTLRNATPRELLLELPGLALFEAAKGVQALRRPHLRRALRDQWAGVRASLAERGRR